MNYIGQLLGWVMLQSAWQTLAIALLLGWSLSLMQRESASRRYRCAVLHLVATIAAVAMTLIASHLSIAASHTQATADHLQSGWLPRLQDRSGAFLPALACIWLGGFVAGQLVLALSFVRMRRFKRSTVPAPGLVTAMVEEMCRTIGLSSPIEVRCANIGSPMISGERPTLIVVPLSFDETYPPGEMRALLAHEVAHIVRRDYSRNILQLFAISLLWWHPGAWLIYARIRHERECASDERALRFTGSAASLAQALVRLADGPMRTENIVIAAAASGLVDRISRLAEMRGSRGPCNIYYGSAVAFAGLAAIIAGVSLTAAKSESLTRAYAASAIGPDTVFTIRAHDPAGNFLVKMVRGRVVAIELEQQPVPVDRVLQSGDTVTVKGVTGDELLRIEVDPRGGLRWTARHPS